MSKLAKRGQTCVVNDDSLGLEAADHRIHRVLLPISLGLAPLAVKPDAADLAVARAEQLDALAEEIEVRGKIRVESLVVPIEIGMVEEGADAVAVAGIDKLADEIPSYIINGAVIVEPAGIVEREAVVMTRCQGNILASRTLRGENELLRPVGLGAEFGRVGSVFLAGDLMLMHYPLAVRENAVNSEMHEHSESHIFKILDVLMNYHIAPPFFYNCTIFDTQLQYAVRQKLP